VSSAAHRLRAVTRCEPVTVVEAPYRPVPAARSAVDIYVPRLPGVAARYLQGLAAHTTARGWTRAETLGLLAAVEERMAVWLLRPRRLGRVLAERQPAGPSDLGAAVSEIAIAGSRGGVGLAAVSGRRAPVPLLRQLGLAGARIGRVDGGAAAELGLRWAVEVAVVPALAPAGLASLREQIAVAPRCSWCRVPVLGTSCRRCLGAGP
jgi:hypothetical protein